MRGNGLTRHPTRGASSRIVDHPQVKWGTCGGRGAHSVEIKSITMNTPKKNTELKINRRNYLAAAGALLAGSALPALADHDQDRDRGGRDKEDVLYGHGLVWNRDLPGVDGDLKLAFDLRVNLETGAGFGTANDPIHPDANVHFSIDSTERKRLRGGETRYSMNGVVTRANNPASVGLPVRILAETRGPTTAIAIAIGNKAFAGAGLVVIAIIAILIGLLLPAVQKVAPR
jgi:hypothetical protein